jgi:hypothetical protein
VDLPLSRQTRLARLYRHAVYKQGPRHLLLPIGEGDLMAQLASMLDDLVPLADGPAGPIVASRSIQGS